MQAHAFPLRLLIFAVTFLVFFRLTRCDFVNWDDQQTLSGNPRLNPPSFATLRYYWTTAGEAQTMGLYVPVTYTVWTALAAISRLFSGAANLNPAWFHTTNVLLHACTAVLVFELLRRLLAAPAPAALGALVFALHPVQVEAVAWASGTKDLLCGMFSVASLLVYLHALQTQRVSSRGLHLAALTLFVLAMLSKPTAVVVPAMASIISIVILKRPVWRALAGLIPWFVLTIPFLIVAEIVQPPAWSRSLPAWADPLVATDALAFYFFKLIWPVHFCVDYGRTPRAIAANHQLWFTWIIPVAITLLLIWNRKKSRPGAAAILFVLPLAPVLGFVPFEFQQYSTVADHYLYLPMVGVAMLMAAGVARSAKSNPFPQQTIPALTAVVITILAALSIHQQTFWKDTRTLFTHNLQINPHSGPALTSLAYLDGRDAMVFKQRGKTLQANQLFNASTAFYQRVLDADPLAVAPMYNIAFNDRESGQLESARAMVRQIVRIQPQLPAPERADVLTIATLLADFGMTSDEVAWLQQAAIHEPGNRKISDRLTAVRTKSADDAVTRPESLPPGHPPR